MNREFQVADQAGRVAIQVSRAWFSIHNGYGIQITPGFDVPLGPRDLHRPRAGRGRGAGPGVADPEPAGWPRPVLTRRWRLARVARRNDCLTHAPPPKSTTRPPTAPIAETPPLLKMAPVSSWVHEVPSADCHAAPLPGLDSPSATNPDPMATIRRRLVPSSPELGGPGCQALPSFDSHVMACPALFPTATQCEPAWATSVTVPPVGAPAGPTRDQVSPSGDLHTAGRPPSCPTATIPVGPIASPPIVAPIIALGRSSDHLEPSSDVATTPVGLSSASSAVPAATKPGPRPRLPRTTNQGRLRSPRRRTASSRAATSACRTTPTPTSSTTATSA